ncbi:MAG: hypothetical protein MR407_06305 [Roseburia sp.]|nr:hypothetical protein [Roseburia sp.]
MRKRMMSLLLAISVLSQCFTGVSFAKAKTKNPVETWFADGEHLSVARRRYGLIAKNVDEVRLNSDSDFFEVYIRQNNKFKEVQLTEKKGKKYKMGTVAVNAKVSYPTDNGDITVDAQNRVLFTGFTTCDYWAKHTSKKQCEKAGRWAHPYIDKVMETDVANTWSGNDMFAYCKNNDNRLYITGPIIASLTGHTDEYCYKYDTVKTYFEGSADQIKQVVCYATGGGRSSIFVLMNDGSVWGIGANEHKLISNSKKKNYRSFVKIIDGGVTQIAASRDQIAVVKEDNTLWIWGRDMKKSKRKYSATPKKIADNVSEVAVSTYQIYDRYPIVVYLKKDGSAYGMGYNYTDKNEGFAVFTDKYKKGWNRKPVLLMKNVKHVYAATNATLMLTNKKELYWTGSQGWYGGCEGVKY